MKKHSDIIFLLEYIIGAVPSFGLLLGALFLFFMGYVHTITIVGIIGTSALIVMATPVKELVFCGNIIIKIILIIAILSGCILAMSFLYQYRNDLGVNGYTLVFLGPIIVGTWQVYNLIHSVLTSNDSLQPDR